LAEAKAAEQTATASVQGLSAASGGGGNLVLRSPITGVIIDRDVVQGQLVGPEHTLFRVGDLSKLWLTAHVFERDAVRVRVGSIARVVLTAFPGKTFEARVTLIGSEIEAVSRTIPVRLELANQDGAIRPGMSASVSIPLGGDAGTLVTVPLASLQRVGESWGVFLPKGEGRFEFRAVGRGRELGGEVEILQGLQAGHEVVVDGAFLLKAEADKARGEGAGHHDH
jgi:cobalt-zinc-cadmium efflux system membrane fusion protein